MRRTKNRPKALIAFHQKKLVYSRRFIPNQYGFRDEQVGGKKLAAFIHFYSKVYAWRLKMEKK